MEAGADSGLRKEDRRRREPFKMRFLSLTEENRDHEATDVYYKPTRHPYRSARDGDVVDPYVRYGPRKWFWAQPPRRHGLTRPTKR